MKEAEETKMQASGNNISNSGDTEASTRFTSSVLKLPKPSSSTGVFPCVSRVCLFFSLARKGVKWKEQSLSSTELKNCEQNIRKYVEWLDGQILPV